MSVTSCAEALAARRAGAGSTRVVVDDEDHEGMAQGGNAIHHRHGGVACGTTIGALRRARVIWFHRCCARCCNVVAVPRPSGERHEGRTHAKKVARARLLMLGECDVTLVRPESTLRALRSARARHWRFCAHLGALARQQQGHGEPRRGRMWTMR